jgi:N-acetylglucosamine kinase-like BadF-type ATPase
LEKSTPLNDAICSFLETQEPAVLAEAARRRSETDGRGFLVPLVLEAARGSNDEAINLYVGAAGWLAAQARAVYSRLAFGEPGDVPVATIGGMWEAGELLLTPFRQLVERWMPQATVVAPDDQPVMGAARMARRALTTPPAAP